MPTRTNNATWRRYISAPAVAPAGLSKRRSIRRLFSSFFLCDMQRSGPHPQTGPVPLPKPFAVRETISPRDPLHPSPAAGGLLLLLIKKQSNAMCRALFLILSCTVSPLYLPCSASRAPVGILILLVTCLIRRPRLRKPFTVTVASWVSRHGRLPVS